MSAKILASTIGLGMLLLSGCTPNTPSSNISSSTTLLSSQSRALQLAVDSTQTALQNLNAYALKLGSEPASTADSANFTLGIETEKAKWAKIQNEVSAGIEKIDTELSNLRTNYTAILGNLGTPADSSLSKTLNDLELKQASVMAGFRSQAEAMNKQIQTLLDGRANNLLIQETRALVNVEEQVLSALTISTKQKTADEKKVQFNQVDELLNTAVRLKTMISAINTENVNIFAEVGTLVSGPGIHDRVKNAIAKDPAAIDYTDKSVFGNLLSGVRSALPAATPKVLIDNKVPPLLDAVLANSAPLIQAMNLRVSEMSKWQKSNPNFIKESIEAQNAEKGSDNTSTDKQLLEVASKEYLAAANNAVSTSVQGQETPFLKQFQNDLFQNYWSTAITINKETIRAISALPSHTQNALAKKIETELSSGQNTFETVQAFYNKIIKSFITDPFSYASNEYANTLVNTPKAVAPGTLPASYNFLNPSPFLFSSNPYANTRFFTPKAVALGSDFTSTRESRISLGADLSGLSFNGKKGDNFSWDAPIYLKLKGNMDASWMGKINGIVSYKIKNTVVGTVFDIQNKAHLKQTEASILLSHSYHNIFLEGQLGSVYTSTENGTRAQATIGYDAKYISPFIQLNHQSWATHSHTTGYLGLEVGSADFKLDTAQLSGSLITKLGTNGSACLSWNGQLNLSEGLHMDGNLELTPLDSKMSFSISRDF
jgi:hypothetical protein